jgi:membrane protein
VNGIAGRARRLYAHALAAAERYPSIAVGIDVVRRDLEVAGTLLAGALAFRIFIWLLPCCLLLAALAGFSETSSRSPEELTRDLGMSPLTANMLGQVGEQAERGRWVTAVVGVLLLVWAGVALGRVLDRVHGRVWRGHADRRAKPTLARVARYNAALLLVVFGNVAGPAFVAVTDLPPVLVSLPSLAFYVLVGIVLLSPQWPPAWRSAWRGALLIAVGMEGLHLVAVLYLPGKLARASQLYGALGVAASLLVWLALIARLVVLAQVLNAVLAERRAAGDPATPPVAGDAGPTPDADAVRQRGVIEGGRGR